VLKKYRVIYTPTGKAREYSPAACNIYLGCDNGCKYCYAPSINFKTREEYLQPRPRQDILKKFEADCKEYNGGQVQFCFMTDPYNSLESKLNLTRNCLEIALENKVPVSILTKSKMVLDDLYLIKRFGDNIQVGFTLTFSNKNDSSHWEPHASSPEERLRALYILKNSGVQTWASFEPVIIPKQSLEMMISSLDDVDIYKVGKLNNYKGLDKQIDWNDFLSKAVSILRNNNKKFYVKHDLRVAGSRVKLYGNEVLMDEYSLSGWQ
jgi:DNA repair photolyase